MMEARGMNSGRLSDKQIAEFEQRGYVILRNFLDLSIVDRVKQSIEEVQEEIIQEYLEKGLISNAYPEAPFETRLTKIYSEYTGNKPTEMRPQLHKAGMFDLFFNPPLLDIIESILGPEIRLYPNYTVRDKVPNSEATLVLWHQDAGYTATGGGGIDEDNPEQDAETLRMVNAWTPIVPATVENGCMQFVPGTHKLGVVPHFQKNKYYLEIAEDELQPQLSQAVNIEMDPGDVALFSNLIFHCGLPNQSSHIRWSVDWRYQDATQSTARKAKGHIARSSNNPASAVQDARDWAGRSFL